MDEELAALLAKAAEDRLPPEAIDAMVKAHAAEKAAKTPLPAAATRGMLPPSGPNDLPAGATMADVARIQLGKDNAGYDAAAEAAWQDTKDHPLRKAAQIGAMAVPGVLFGAATKYGGPTVRAVANFAAKTLDNPVVGGGLGAYHGYNKPGGGVVDAVLEGAMGAAGSSALAKKLHAIGEPGPAAPAPEPPVTMPKASVGPNGSAPSTETAMRGGPMPQGPIPWVMHVPERPPMPPMRTSTGAPDMPMAPMASHPPNGMRMSVPVTEPTPAPAAPPVMHTATGAPAEPMIPNEPIPFVMHAPGRPARPQPSASTTTGTGAPAEPPPASTAVNPRGFTMDVPVKPKPAAASTEAPPAKATDTPRPQTPPAARPAGPATTEPAPTTEPTTTTTDRPPTKSKRRSQVDGLSEADIDARAASRGVSRDTIIAEEEAALRQRAERHIAKLQAANAQPTTVMAEIMKYRDRFGADFAKGK